jgi:hypothetical protein
MSYGTGPCLGGGLWLGSQDMGVAPTNNCTCSDPNGTAPTPCDAPPGGPVPVQQPSSGIGILFDGVIDGVGFVIAGLAILCAETGVSLISDCSAVILFHAYPSIGAGYYNFTTPGGGGCNCHDHMDHEYYASTEPQLGYPAFHYSFQVVQIPT